MPSTPTISVVLPVYNAARYVREAIDSILHQTYRDFELLIIDDGSTDNSLRIIHSAVDGDRRGRVISRPNKGLVASCNEGIAEARGIYVFRMDADDEAHPDRFTRQVRFLEDHPECVAVGTRVMLADDSMMPIIESFKRLTHADIDAENMQGQGSAICHPTAAFRRDALLVIGGYRKEFEWAEDLDLFLRLAEVGRLANLPDVLLSYRQHMDSVGYSKRALQHSRTGLAVRAAEKRRGLSKPGSMMHAEAPGASGGDLAAPSDYLGPGDIHRKWAWLALIGGNAKTARKHALLALRTDPWCLQNPKLIACAIRGR